MSWTVNSAHPEILASLATSVRGISGERSQVLDLTIAGLLREVRQETPTWFHSAEANHYLIEKHSVVAYSGYLFGRLCLVSLMEKRIYEDLGSGKVRNQYLVADVIDQYENIPSHTELTREPPIIPVYWMPPHTSGSVINYPYTPTANAIRQPIKNPLPPLYPDSVGQLHVTQPETFDEPKAHVEEAITLVLPDSPKDPDFLRLVKAFAGDKKRQNKIATVITRDPAFVRWMHSFREDYPEEYESMGGNELDKLLLNP